MSEANNDGGGKGKVSNPKDNIADAKIPLWLCSPIAKINWALAQFAGLLKYGAWNWRIAGVRASVYISALERHVDAYKSGEDLDPIDKTKHLGNIMACAALLMEAEAANRLTDDRPPLVDHRPTIAAGEKLIAELKEQYKDRAPRHWTIADKLEPVPQLNEPHKKYRWLMTTSNGGEYWETSEEYTLEELKQFTSVPVHHL